MCILTKGKISESFRAKEPDCTLGVGDYMGCMCEVAAEERGERVEAVAAAAIWSEARGHGCCIFVGEGILSGESCYGGAGLPCRQGGLL